MSRVKGFAAEERAASYLQELGFTIVERNFTIRGGEIDIVASKGGILHFVEVKYSAHRPPHERITPAKIQRLSRAIAIYMARRGFDLPYQLDALCIWDGGIELVENITL
ncbi:MAG: hypothetical protein C6I00_06180 [Nitratiruptor sp.]|nr:hypothetical protein [Nitratiruptor sp.]NPA83031.1 YraN family protein [Campylobacterota bacterium]